jgi:alpha-glucuronidase
VPGTRLLTLQPELRRAGSILGLALVQHSCICFLLLAFAICARPAAAEDGRAAWLRYQPIPGGDRSRICSALPGQLVLVNAQKRDAVIGSAGEELVRGIASMCGRRLHTTSAIPQGDAFIVGTTSAVEAELGGWRAAKAPGPEGYALLEAHARGHRYIVVAGADARGTLYGSFALLSQVGQARGAPLTLDRTETPASPLRWINQWDNLDGSIERGYAGRSIFFENGAVRADLERAAEYARLLASVGINGCTINNVNADSRLLTPAMIGEVARIADAFRPWGVRLSLSIDFSSPQSVGGLETFDPLDPRVREWWQKTVDAVYARIPDFSGFVVKADSEGKPGPSQYGRSPVQAANMLARVLKAHAGLVLYRGFVYNQHLDWRDRKADRAKAGFDTFSKLDGAFDDNVVIQVKNGPIDFQVREPASPLFGALRQTNQAIELQITQEYLGQQRHLVYLVPQWKTTLDTDMRAENRSTPVKEIVEGKTFHRPLGGFVGVANVGLDQDWVAHPLAMANLYGFARLAWDPNLSSEQIVDEWTRLSFGNDPLVDRTIESMELGSWKLYEDYTGPLGLGTLTDILGAHYGPGIASAEGNGWGQWLRADHAGVGMDRTVASGTGYIGQYPPELARRYESVSSCPDALLLFMHHVAYTHILHSGKTVIQHIYDSHYEGAAGALELALDWQRLEGRIDGERYQKVLALERYQAGHAIVWRDAVTNWFERISGIADAKGRVGNYPDRIEAESMQLEGYSPVEVTPWETASGGKAVVCPQAECRASSVFDRGAGLYRVSVEYFDFHDGTSRYTLLLNARPLAEWTADHTLPTNKMNGSTSTRYIVPVPVELKSGDRIEIIGRPDKMEPAPLDYVSITAAPGAELRESRSRR